MKLAQLEELLEKYTYYAGVWHDEGCACISYDKGVCNCKTERNKGEVAQFLLDLE